MYIYVYTYTCVYRQPVSSYLKEHLTAMFHIELCHTASRTIRAKAHHSCRRELESMELLDSCSYNATSVHTHASGRPYA